jgi:4-amino-4-deoxy-L-arabinose transferase-like glycosyltransferase
VQPSSTRPPAGRRATIAAASIVLVALAIRVAVVEATPGFAPRTDAYDYDRHAVALERTHAYPPPTVLTGGGTATAFRPPLYPLTLAGVYLVTGTQSPGRRWHAGRLVQALMGTLVVALVALLAWELAGAAAGLAAGAIAAVFPPLVMVGASLLTENLFLILELAAVLAVLRHRRSRVGWAWLAGAGLCAGLAALDRGNGLLVAIPLALGAWTAARGSRRRGVAGAALVLVAAVLAVAPWTVRNAVALHAFVPVTTQSGFGFAGQYNPDVQRAQPPALWRPPFNLAVFAPLFLHRPPLGEVLVDRRLSAAARRYVLGHPLAPARAAFWNGRRLLALDGTRLERMNAVALGIPARLSDASVYAFLVLLPLAVAGALTSTARRVPRWVWLVPILLMGSVVFVSGTQRYRTLADPFWILLASFALTSPAAPARLRRRPSAPAG